MFKKYILTAAVMAVLPFAPAKAELSPLSEIPAGKYELDMSHASLHFKVSHIGLSNYTARFTDFAADLDFDPSNPENSTLTATINPASVETDYPNPEEKDFDKKLATDENWFNAGAFPEAKFVATDIKKTSENTGTVTGDFTFLGMTKPLTLDVTFNGGYKEKPFAKVAALGFSATGSFKRSEWGFDTYVPSIGDDIELILELEFHKVSEEEASE